MQRAGVYPAPPGSPQDIPGLELAGEVAALGPGADALRRRATASWRSSAAAGRPSWRVVHERQLMPVPDGARLAAGGRPARGLHDRPRRDLHAGRRCAPASACSSTARPAASAPPPSSSARPRARTSPRPSATRTLRDAVARARRPRGRRPRGLRRPRPVRRRSSSSSARPTSPANLERAGHAAAGSSSIGVGAGAKAELNLLALMGKRGAHPRLDAARPPAGGEGADRPRASSATCCRCFARGALRVPVAETFAARPTSPRPTSASPPAASSARSS